MQSLSSDRNKVKFYLDKFSLLKSELVEYDNFIHDNLVKYNLVTDEQLPSLMDAADYYFDQISVN